MFHLCFYMGAIGHLWQWHSLVTWSSFGTLPARCSGGLYGTSSFAVKRHLTWGQTWYYCNEFDGVGPVWSLWQAFQKSMDLCVQGEEELSWSNFVSHYWRSLQYIEGSRRHELRDTKTKWYHSMASRKEHTASLQTDADRMWENLTLAFSPSRAARRG